jgi:TolA-binding protein
MELDDKKEAVSFYLKAGERKKNSFTSPLYLKKAGMVMEDLQQYDKALKTYENIKMDYPESEEGKQIDKYIAALKIKMN